MARSYWLVNSNRSRVKRFIENKNNKDKFFKYMFKIELAREEWKKLITLGWRRTEEVWTKKDY